MSNLEEIKDLKQRLGNEIVIAAEDELILNEFQDIGVKIKSLQDEQNLLKQDVIDILEDYELARYENNKGLISYSKASTRNSIDSAKLRKELPDVAEKYTKTSNVKASVRFKAK
ncbi:hypothetical protein FEZ33_01340 [Ruoffia tabacinasalis]|uniref:Uncharacterized protein n=1 Tax=Ruoffia tabacinasalis TaxID=87458 RepID=A0A5R9EGK4_9LACT|nr:hypothetical protein [Ruoffia tabacinasalis]TLQ49304.1 hypothetical protein FEZ33_01340 [Ruoffia tabacinasalis]